MMASVQAEHDLPTLRFRLDRSAGPGGVTMEAVRGDGEPTYIGAYDVRDLVEASRDNRRTRSPRALPSALVGRIDAAVSDLGESPLQPFDALWLELPPPRGMLSVVPWERLLAPLDRLLLRLPQHGMRTELFGPHLDVALCLAVPRGAEVGEPVTLLLDLARRYLGQNERPTTVHLLSDPEWHDDVVARASEQLSEHSVVLHDPWDGDMVPGPGSPWERGVLWDLAGVSPDVLHIVAGGWLGNGRGAVVVPDAPRGPDARFIGSVELIELLTQTGAPALAVSVPAGAGGVAGVRAVAEDVSFARPGAVLVHDAELDPDATQFARALRAALVVSDAVVGPLPAVSAWVQPRLTAVPSQTRDDLQVREDGSSSLVQPATRAALFAGGAPWIGAAARSIERLQVRWLRSSTDQAVDHAVVQSLTNVAALVERYVVAESAPRSAGVENEDKNGGEQT